MTEKKPQTRENEDTLDLPRDLFGRPLVDLLERPIKDFGPLFEEDDGALPLRSLPSELPLPRREVLEQMDNILRHHVVQAIRREMDFESWEELVIDIRRLVPHEMRERLDKEGERPWSSRWQMLADTLATAVPRAPCSDDLPIHGVEVLRAVSAHPGISEDDLLILMKLRPVNFARILGLMEARDYIRREMRGKELKKFVHLGPRALETLDAIDNK